MVDCGLLPERYDVRAEGLREPSTSTERGAGVFSMRELIRWSCRFWPTPGRWWTGVTPTSCRCLESPTPDNRRIWGEPILPADRTTSWRAKY